MYVHTPQAQIHTCTNAHASTNTDRHATHTHTHTHAHTHTHTHAHTRTPAEYSQYSSRPKMRMAKIPRQSVLFIVAAPYNYTAAQRGTAAHNILATKVQGVPLK